MALRRRSFAGAAVLLGLCCACGESQSGATEGGGAAGGAGGAGGGAPAGDHEREVPGFAGRTYLLHVPSQTSALVPLVLVIHGGGGDAESMRLMTCPDGDLSSPRCMDALADAAGFAVVYPRGTGPPVAPALRTWNAGGGEGEWQCVSGFACANQIDDLAYFDALLDDVGSFVPIDPKRVFATGLSNGAAMSHRLACARADRIAAIAPVAGGNQLSTSASCAPSRPVAVLALHGTADPCWAFDGGSAACAQVDGKNKIDIPTTMADWAARDGCDSAPAVSALADTDPEDGTLTSVEDYPSCDGGSAVQLYRIEGGGHTWPGGNPYSTTVGPVAKDFDANAAMWEFFAAHPAP